MNHTFNIRSWKVNLVLFLKYLEFFVFIPDSWLSLKIDLINYRCNSHWHFCIKYYFWMNNGCCSPHEWGFKVLSFISNHDLYCKPCCQSVIKYQMMVTSDQVFVSWLRPQIWRLHYLMTYCYHCLHWKYYTVVCSSPDWAVWVWVLFFGQTHYSHSASLHPDV